MQGSDWVLSQVQYIVKGPVNSFFHLPRVSFMPLYCFHLHEICLMCSCDVGTSEALCGGFLPALCAPDNHSWWTKPLLERGAAAAILVTAVYSCIWDKFLLCWVTDQLKCRPVVLCSAPNGDYSAASLQSVKDEVFINIFDEVVYETGVVSKRHSDSLPERVELFFTMEHAVLLRPTEKKGNQSTPG